MAVERTWTIKAAKRRGGGLTVAELMDALELAPPGSQPKAVVSLTGRIRELTVTTSREEEK